MSLNTQAVGKARMSSSHTHFYSPPPLPLPVPKISFLSSREGELRFHPLTEYAASSVVLFRHRRCKNVVCWLERCVCVISPGSVRSFCHLPCVFCIFQRIASFQQHQLSSHWKWEHVLCRNFPLSGAGFPHWGLSTPACNAVFLSTGV